MATLVEFRAQNPEYNDMPDVALADALHSKFYADVPKPQFYKQLGLVGADIPGAANVTTMQPKPVSMQDRIMGAIESPAIVAGDLTRMVTMPIAKYGTEALTGWNTPEGIKAGQQAAQTVSGQLYQPRTETGPEIVNQLGKALSALPPTYGALGNKLSVLSGPAISQARNIVAPAAVSTQQRMAALLQSKQPPMMGGGAASTDEALLRQQRAMSQNIPLTKGEQLQDFGLLKRESDIPKENPELAKGLIEFKQGQKQKILQRFEDLAEQTGTKAVPVDTNLRSVGTIVDKEIVKQFDAKKTKVDEAYQAARDAGETKQVVDTALLDQWLENNAGKAISVPEIKSIKADLKALKKATNGQVTIDDLEELYKSAGQLGKKGDPSGVFMGQVKDVINDITEGKGGDLYRAARTQRKELGNDFENTYRVAKLLGTKGGYADRAVALDDVFSHVVLEGSLEEMQTVTKLLKKGGPQGQQAYAELQGQTVQYLKDQLTKNASDELSYAKLKNAINNLDQEEKLAYMFGKQGREILIDLRDTLKDALVKPPGAVNYSNTGSVVLRGLEKLAALKFPLAKDAVNMAKNIEIKKQVEESTKYNALADALKGKK